MESNSFNFIMAQAIDSVVEKSRIAETADGDNQFENFTWQAENTMDTQAQRD